MNKIGMHLAMMAAMFSYPIIDSSSNGHMNHHSDKVHFNEKKKCFRKGCNNHRNGHTELYCSEECKQLYRDENKHQT